MTGVVTYEDKLRDRLAEVAMTHFLQVERGPTVHTGQIAKNSYAVADAMIEARAIKRPEQ